MSDLPDDRVAMGQAEVPAVLLTLAGVLPRFEGADLESQLETYDTFLGILSPTVRPQIADLLRRAAAQAENPASRARLEAAAESIAQGGRAAAPYDHAQAMAEYQNAFRQSFPDAPLPPPPADDASGENDAPAAPAVPVTTTSPRAHPEILAQLDKIEAEMKRINYWSASPPDLQAAAARGEIKSYLDAPTFELWLQGIFLPNARQRTLEDDLPESSMVGEMARRQYDYMSIDYNAHDLMHLLRDFDELVIKTHS